MPVFTVEHLSLVGAALAIGLMGGVITHWLDARVDILLDHGFHAAWRYRTAVRCWHSIRGIDLAGFPFILSAAWLASDRTQGIMVAILFSALTICTVIDARHHIIPDLVVFPLGCGGFLLSIFHPILVMSGGDAIVGLAAGMGPAGLLWYRRRWSDDAIGLGDVKLLGALGMWLGPIRVSIVFFIAAAVILAMLLGVRVKKSGPTGSVPFAPAISASVFVILCVELVCARQGLALG